MTFDVSVLPVDGTRCPSCHQPAAAPHRAASRDVESCPVLLARYLQWRQEGAA